MNAPAGIHSVSIHEAKTRLSQLIAAVEAGEEVIIRRGREPVAKLLPVKPRAKRVPGAWKGLIISMTDDAFAPMTDEELGWSDSDDLL